MIQTFSDKKDRKEARKSLRDKYTDHPRPIPQSINEYELKEYFITLDSRDRDRTAWPSSSQFQVKMQPENTFNGAMLGRAFKNVRSIEVVTTQYPNTLNVLDQMYLYLCFPEIDGVYESTNITGNKALAKLVATSLIGNYVYIEYPHQNRPRRLFPGKGARIDRLTPEFRTYNGALFNFGTDTIPPNACDPKLQTSITLRIIVQIPNTL